MHRRSTLPLLLATAGAMTALLATSLAAPATAGDRSAEGSLAAATSSGADSGARSHGERLLARANDALDEDHTGEAGTSQRRAEPSGGGAAHHGRDDATMALRDLFVARPGLEEEQQRHADDLLARPSDGGSDPYGDGYTVPSVKRCSAHFCIHWVTSTDDRATDAWVATTLSTMEAVWHHHIDELGYRAPPTDGKRGGNSKFDIYLKNLGSQGLYGYCAPERKVAGEPHAASSFCVLDNNFSRAEYHRAPIQALEVTAAHEFFHAIQFGYDYHEDRWILEATAVWMEERFADDVNDNRMYLPYGQVGIPSEPLDTFDASGFNQYGNWAFFEYLSEHYGNGIIRNLWQHLGNGHSAKQSSIQGVRTVLASHGGLPAVYAAYAGGNTVPGHTYEEGASFPATQIATTKTLTKGQPRRSWTTHVDHLAAKDLQIRPGSSLTGKHWKLKLTISAPRAATSPAGYVIVHQRGGGLVRRPLDLSHGHRSVSLSFGHHFVTVVTVTVANVSTRYACHRHTTFSCAGKPLDNRQRFQVTASALKRS